MIVLKEGMYMKPRRRLFIFRWDIKIWLALAVILACIEGAFWSYQELYERTPDYSFHVLVTAMTTGDTETVSQYVDESTLTNELFDSIVQYTGTPAMTLSPLNVAWTPIKADYLSLSHQVWQTYVIGRSGDAAYDATYQAFQNRLRSLHFPIPPEGWQYERTHWSRETSDSTAELTVDLYNTTLQDTIPVTLSLERTGSKTWKVIGFAAPTAMLDAIHNAYVKGLAKKNEPIQKQLDNIVTIHAVTAMLVSNTATGQKLIRLQYTPEFHVDRETINEIKGTYTLRRNADQAVLYTANLRLSSAAEKTTYMTQFLLNPFIPSQFQLSQMANLDDTTSTLAVTSVRLQNGTEYTLDTQLYPGDAAKEE